MDQNRTISIADIKANPFQSRKTADPAAIKRLATEIQETGYWGESFRVRQHNGNYQLVFGHQRLEALRQLGHKRIGVEVVDLTDVEMAEQSLIENLQRHNLLEIDKAEAIRRVVEMYKGQAGSDLSDAEIIRRLMTLLGYQNETTLKQFLGMSRLSEATKQEVRKSNMPRGAVAVARGIGGEDMVRHAATHHISELDLKPISKSVAPLPAPMRQKVVERILQEKATKPQQVEKIVRHEQEKVARQTQIPPDVMLFIRKWTGDLDAWTAKIKAATKVKSYIHQHPEIVTKFKDAAERFIAALKELLDLR